VKQVQLFDSAMAMRRIRGARGKPYEQTDAVVLCIRRKQSVGKTGRRFFPVLFSLPFWRWHHRLLARLQCDSSRKALPQGD